MQGIYRIRAYLKEHDEQRMNTTALAINASAFGIYLLSLFVLNVTGTIYYINPSSNNSLIFAWASGTYLVLNFFSQALLCYIFWDLGTKKEEEETDQEDEEADYAPTQTEVFDEEDEVQARIWNAFLRE